LRITFLLPPTGPIPTGGSRIIYEYADRLQARGHEVRVLHVTNLPFSRYAKRLPPIRWIKEYLRHRQELRSHRDALCWFPFSQPVQVDRISRICDAEIPDGDIVFSTWWATAHGVQKLRPSAGRKFYLVQHYETWGGAKHLVEQTYLMGQRIVVVSHWLKDRLAEIQSAVYGVVPNAIDTRIFKQLSPLTSRRLTQVGMIYSGQEFKRCADGIQALRLVKEKFPDLQVEFVGACPAPEGLEPWITYIQNPSQQDLVQFYNRQTIFISSSHVEGFGLPGAEALACGCALATTNSGGVMDYAIHEQTALVSEPLQPQELANNIERLLRDEELRIRTAATGQAFVQTQLDWNKAVETMEALLQQSGQA